jgi:hypothetical protein
MLRLRGDDRVAIITAPLSMTGVIGRRVPSAAEAGIIFGGSDGTAGSRALSGICSAGGGLGGGELHRSFVGSRSRCVRLRFLRMTGAGVPQTQGKVPSAAEA